MNALIALLIILTAPAAVAVATPDGPELPAYRCTAATQPIRIDGKLGDRAWATAAWTSDFVPLRGPAAAAQPAPPRTRAKLLWDQRHLYVAAQLTEPDVRATGTGDFPSTTTSIPSSSSSPAHSS